MPELLINDALAESNSAPQYFFLSLSCCCSAFIGLIDEMVSTLNAEQQQDNDKKKYCGAEFDSADDKKKALEHSIGDLETAIAKAEEAIATAKEESEALIAGIKELDKTVAEATVQR